VPATLYLVADDVDEVEKYLLDEEAKKRLTKHSKECAACYGSHEQMTLCLLADEDIETYVNQDSTKVPVHTLRKLIPNLRNACYFSNICSPGLFLFGILANPKQF